MKATVIIPTFDHCELIRFPIESILRQTHKNFELFVIGDGAPDKTEDLVREYEKKDSRVKYFKHKKGPRLGEAYRHPILMNEASGDFVCYLADDDLYLDNHLEVIAKELCSVDFTHTLPSDVIPDGSFHVYLIDLKIAWYRDLLVYGTNRIPLGMGAHRMDFYKNLPYGWRTTPKGTPTDLYMWQQILRYGNPRLSSLKDVTVLHFPNGHRINFTLEERLKELEHYSEIIQDSKKREKLIKEIYKSTLNTAVNAEADKGNEIIFSKSNFEIEINNKCSEIKDKNDSLEEKLVEINNKNIEILDKNKEIEKLEHQNLLAQNKISELNLQVSSKAYTFGVKTREFLRKLGILKIVKLLN